MDLLKKDSILIAPRFFKNEVKTAGYLRYSDIKEVRSLNPCSILVYSVLSQLSTIECSRDSETDSRHKESKRKLPEKNLTMRNSIYFLFDDASKGKK